MPERVATAERRSETARAVRFRRPAVEIIQRAARRVVRGGKASFPSQSAFRAAVLDVIRRDEPLAAIGGARLRRLILDVPGVHLAVRYTERPDRGMPARCPVCGSELAPIRNRTLTGETIVLGRRCTRCAYWTHAARRVPVRYTFSKAGFSGRVRPAPN